MQAGNVSFNGSIVPNKSSFSIIVQQARLFDSGNILAARPGRHGRPRDSAPDRSRRTSTPGSIRRSATAHLLKFSYQRAANELQESGRRQLRPGRARVSSRRRPRTCSGCPRTAPSGAAGFSESRLQIRWAETGGGVGRRGADHPRARCVHERRRPAQGRQPRGGLRGRDGFRLRARRCTRCAQACSPRADATARTIPRTTSAPTRSRASRTTRPAGRRTTRAASAIRA